MTHREGTKTVKFKEDDDTVMYSERPTAKSEAQKFRVTVSDGKPRFSVQMSQSFDFREDTLITSNPQDYSLLQILKRMRKHKIDHLNYDSTYFAKTKQVLEQVIDNVDKN